MAKPKSSPKNPGGPFLATAVFCDSVVTGQDGAKTVVRIVDHIKVSISADAPEDVPSADRRLLTKFAGLIGFKKGSGGAKHIIKLIMNSPSGAREVMVEQEAVFRDEPHGGYDLNLSITMSVSEAGLYWMDVFLDRLLMTRMPLQITVTRAAAEPSVIKQAPAKTKRRTGSGSRARKSTLK